MIDEIPTLAIETVFVHNNTSIVQDEVLAARLGLVPLTGAREGINWIMYEKKRPTSLDDEVVGPGAGEERDSRDNNTVVLKLQVECGWNPNRKKDDTESDQLYTNSNVYARDIKFEPMGRQAQFFSSDTTTAKDNDDDGDGDGDGDEEENGDNSAATSTGVVRAVNPDILLAKMRPGQCMDLEMHAIKGVGADHAKFSPVATATYRLLPTISILNPIVGDEAIKFARCFPKGVIGLEDITKKESERKGSEFEGLQGQKKAVIKNTMRDTVSRECLRHPEFEGKVKLGRVKDHFIFSVESTGQFESDLLFLKSVRILRAKCEVLQQDLLNVLR